MDTKPGGIILKDLVTHQIPNENKTLVSFASWVANPLSMMLYNILCVPFLDLVAALRKTRTKLTKLPVEGEKYLQGRCCCI